MTRQKFIEKLIEIYDSCVEISKKKNADYADESDPFKNFRMSEYVGVSLPKGVLTRVTDKIVRVGNLLDGDPQVISESIYDSLKDAINYLAFIIIYLEEEQEKADAYWDSVRKDE